MKRIGLVLALSLIPGAAGAQGFWTGQEQRTWGGLEMLVPNSFYGIPAGLPVGQMTASARYRAPTLLIVGEVPFALTGTGRGGMGNLYIGLETTPSEAGVFSEFGLRLPTTEDEQDVYHLVGMAADPDRIEAWAGPFIPVLAAANYRVSNEWGVGARFRGGCSIWIPTGDRAGGGSLLFGVLMFYEGASFAFQGGFSGRAFLGDIPLSPEPDVLGQIVFKLDLLSQQARPGMSLRVRTNDRSVVDYVVGAHLQVGGF